MSKILVCVACILLIGTVGKDELMPKLNWSQAMAEIHRIHKEDSDKIKELEAKVSHLEYENADLKQKLGVK